MQVASSGQIGTTVAAASGALVGGWMESVASAGGAWILAGSMAAAALWETFRGPGHGPPHPGSPQEGMNCATLGGFLGGVVAYALSHVGPGAVTAHLASAPVATHAHLQMLSMLAMNGAMGAMVGHAAATCLRAGRQPLRDASGGRRLRSGTGPAAAGFEAVPGRRPLASKRFREARAPLRWFSGSPV